MIKCTVVAGVLLTALPAPAWASLAPATAPSALALSDIPPSYLSYYTAAARTCPGLPWQVLAAIGSIESDHGRSQAPDVHGPSGAQGPEGPMQFDPATFGLYAVRADKARPLSPYDPRDAIYAAARLLCASGAPDEIARAVYTYNHAGWYVDEVLSLAARYSGSRRSSCARARPRTRAAQLTRGDTTVRYDKLRCAGRRWSISRATSSLAGALPTSARITVAHAASAKGRSSAAASLSVLVSSAITSDRRPMPTSSG